MSKTIEQILYEIHLHRPMSRVQLWRVMKALGIRPLGARQRPQRYPADTAGRILAYLGYAPANGQKLVSLRSLKAEQRKANR